MLIADLSIRSGKQQGKFIRLPSGKFLIGRGEDCHLRPNSDLVSRHHCMFNFDGIALRIKDLGSTNGTFVNNEQVKGTKLLYTGDKVLIGKLEFEVMLREMPVESNTAGLNPEVIESNSDAGLPIRTDSETVTMMEMPVYNAGNPEQFSETQVFQSAETMPGVPFPQQPQNPGQPYPANPQYGGAMQGGYPMNPYGQQPNLYGQGIPMGYPQQPMQGQMPMYNPQMPPGYNPQLPLGYNPQYGGYPQPQYGYPQYPQQMPQGYGYPAQMPAPLEQEVEQPVAEEEPAEEMPVKSVNKNFQTVKLPDPKDTGVKAPPPPDPNAVQAAPVKPEEKPSSMAADILRNMVVRRPNNS